MHLKFLTGAIQSLCYLLIINRIWFTVENRSKTNAISNDLCIQRLHPSTVDLMECHLTLRIAATVGYSRTIYPNQLSFVRATWLVYCYFNSLIMPHTWDKRKRPSTEFSTHNAARHSGNDANNSKWHRGPMLVHWCSWRLFDHTLSYSVTFHLVVTRQ